MNTNENILRISGSAYLEKPLDFGKEYTLKMTAEVSRVAKVSREDGTCDDVFTAKLILVNVIAENEVIRTKGKSPSQGHRLQIMRKFNEVGHGDFEDFYRRFVNLESEYIEEIYNMIKLKI